MWNQISFTLFYLHNVTATGNIIIYSKKLLNKTGNRNATVHYGIQHYTLTKRKQYLQITSFIPK